MFKSINKKLLVASFVLFSTVTGLSAYDAEDFVIAKSQDAQEKEASNQDGVSVFDRVSSVAKNLIGTKYKFGGISPLTGFDCSGFVGYVFREGANIKLPRGSRDMRTLGKPVDLKTLKPGDLVFFKLNSSHVGIYVGDNRFVHAPRTGRSVTIDSMLDSNFANKIIGARRLAEMD